MGRSMVDAYDAYYASGTAPVAMSLLDMKEYPAFHEVFHQYVDGIPQELREELYRELGKDRMKMLAFGSRQAGGSPSWWMYWNSWMPARAYIRMKAPFRH